MFFAFPIKLLSSHVWGNERNANYQRTKRDLQTIKCKSLRDCGQKRYITILIVHFQYSTTYTVAVYMYRWDNHYCLFGIHVGNDLNIVRPDMVAELK